MAKLHLNVNVEKIPDDDAAFQEWCEEHEFDYLGQKSGRRAWCSPLSTYVRGAEYLVTVANTEHEISGYRFLATKAELDQLMLGFDRPDIPVREWTKAEISEYVQRQVDGMKEGNK